MKNLRTAKSYWDDHKLNSGAMTKADFFEAIETAQREAWNAALDEAAKES